MLNIEFDDNKNVLNIAKHGVNMAIAAHLEWDLALVRQDDRMDYGETRWCALVPQASILYFVAYAQRGDALRVISLRKANRREVKNYVENIESSGHQNALHR
jgi:uncharacterized DUF497 family protein